MNIIDSKRKHIQITYKLFIFFSVQKFFKKMSGFRFFQFLNKSHSLSSKVKLSSSLLLGFTLSSSIVYNDSSSSPPSSASSSSLVSHRPSSNSYLRIDSLLDNAHPEWKANNAFHGTLRGENLIEEYEVYSNKEKEEIICLVRYGCSLNGHTGIVHGGITALTFDNSFGWLFLANKYPSAFTANISVNYR